MLPEFPPQKGVLRKRQRELGKRKAVAWPLCPPQICPYPEVSPLPLETYLLPYIPDSQPHPASSELHVYEFLLTLDLKKLLGVKKCCFGDEESLRGISNQDFLQDFWGSPLSWEGAPPMEKSRCNFRREQI